MTSSNSQSATEAKQPASPGGYQFGTFGGVFTPTILTIFGVIMFMRVGFVVGQSGIFHALIILGVAKVITLLTSLSVSAISTNTRVEGGGAYFLISRSLGPEFGGAIGLALYLAQALSVPFYILGFVESLVLIFEGLEPYFLLLSLGVATVLSIITYIGANWAIRVQFFVLALLVLAIGLFMVGLMMNFEPARFQERLASRYTDNYNFWIIFAIYFPAVTGIMAGINMSGDLKNPARSIPKGTLYAVAVGGVVYAIQIILSAGAHTSEQLLNGSFRALVEQTPLNLGIIVILGMFAASLSSAMGSYVGAPRVLQALSRDHIFPLLRIFGKGTGPANEPRQALLMTAVVTFGVLLYAGNNSGGGALNAVASVITMFFLYTYGMTNLAAFVEAFTGNPSFRPRFRFFHYSTALLGLIGCAGAAVLINVYAAVIAAAALGGLFAYIQGREFSVTFGDARRGFYYTRIRELLLKLAAIPSHPKNWRPTVMVFSGNPVTRLTLVRYATWLGCDRGIVTLVEVLRGEPEQMLTERAESHQRLQGFIQHHQLAAFPEVVVAPKFDDALPLLLQSYSIGPLKPNMVLFGWTQAEERADNFVHTLRVASAMHRSIVVLRDRGLPGFGGRTRRIDVWWRGRRNGSLMVILAYLIAQNPEWAGCTLRLLRVVEEETGREPAMESLRQLIGSARVDSDINIVVDRSPFQQVLPRESKDASCVLLGFDSRMLEHPRKFHQLYANLLEEMPTTLLVCSSGEADLMA